MSGRMLVLGCGDSPLPANDEWPEVVNLDMFPLPGVDVVHNLDAYPWPFSDESFDTVIANSVLEHLDDIVRAMEEIHRVLKLKRASGDPGLAIIAVPQGGSFNHYTDPTHKHGFTEHSFDYFDPGTQLGSTSRHYSWARFDLWKVALCTNVRGLAPEVEFHGDLPEHLKHLNHPFGTDLKFWLVKRAADERVREIQRAGGRIARQRALGHGIYQP